MMIPTKAEHEELKSAYRERYGDKTWEYQSNKYSLMEFRLLASAYRRHFSDDIPPDEVVDRLNVIMRQNMLSQ